MSKTVLFQAIQFCQTVLIKTIQFSIIIVFVYSQLNVKTVRFQTIQRNIKKLLHFKQFSLAWVHSLNLKTVLFQTIQFSISTQFSSIWPMDRTLSVATTPGQSWPGSDGNEGVLRIPQTPALLEPHHEIV